MKFTKSKKFFFCTVFFLLMIFLLPAADTGILFNFSQKKGNAVMHTSTVEEEAFINERLQNRTQFINRTTTTVTDVLPNGDALLNTNYMTTQNTLMSKYGNHLSWGEEDSVIIKRTPSGKLYDSLNENLPTVRSVPSFPEKKVKPGDTWTAEGLEVHDCRELFNMTYPIQIPFTAEYKYRGDTVIDGVKLCILDVQYQLYQKSDSSLYYNYGITYAGTSGYAIQEIYWDPVKGDLHHYTEEFEILMADFMGNTFKFHGLSHGEVTGYKSVNDDEHMEQIQETVEKYKLDNVSVKRDEKGLTISLDSIQFEPDSNRLLESEKIKLQKLSEILNLYSNDLLITGHCAERGTVKARQQLSEERAESVASYLEELGVRDKMHIFTQGKGSTQPVATNATEAGRIKNRRVEITLMD